MIRASHATLSSYSPRIAAIAVGVALVCLLGAGSAFAAGSSRLLADDGAANDFFANSVAVDGDYAVAGAPGAGTAGAAYVYVHSGGAWTQQAKLTPTDGAEGDQFGWSVAISGSTVLVGANSDDNAAGTGAGAAYVFTRSGSTWTEKAKLVAGDATAGDAFGSAVAIEDGTALIGATGDDTFRGSAYVFTGAEDSWTQEDKLQAGDGTGEDWFGWSVALDGDQALVGAYMDDTPAGDNAGSAYVFTRSGTDWTQRARLTGAETVKDDGFGYAVALDGSTALIGSWADDCDTDADQGEVGSAYVFTGAASSWTQQAKLVALDPEALDQFGTSVALSGDTAVIGARPDKNQMSAGSAYVLTRSGSTWTQRASFAAKEGSIEDQFGNSVALDPAGTVIIGAPQNDQTASQAGAAYVGPLPSFWALSSSATLPAYGSTYSFSGKVFAGGTAVNAESVALQHATSESGPFYNASLSDATDATGAFSIAVKPYWKRYYRATYDSGAFVAISPVRSVTPRTLVYAPVAPAELLSTRTYYVYGYLKPAHTAGSYPVRIYRWRYVNGAWKSYGYQWAKAYAYNSSTTRYAASVRLPYTGTWALRAYAPADAWHAAAWSSKYDYVKVR